MKNSSDLLIEALVREGVEVIYGIPGEENLDLLEAIRKSGIKLVLNRHEQAGAFMAATYGRVTGKPGVVISTLGPGATNFTTPSAYALLGGFPVVFITGQKPIKKSKQGRFQIIDIVSMMKPLVKMSKQIVDVHMVASTVAEVFAEARSGKPGPVHIEFPEDVSEELITKDTVIMPKAIVHQPADVNKDMALEAVEIIKASKAPLVIFGAGISRPGISSFAEQFIDKTNLPFVNTQMAKGAVSEEHKNYIGTAALSASDYVHDAIEEADVIVSIGHDVIEKPPFFKDHTSTKKLIHFNIDSKNCVDNVYVPDLVVVGGLVSAMKFLSEHLGSIGSNFTYFNKVKDALSQHTSDLAFNKCFPLHPAKLVSDVNEVANQNVVVSLDNGMYKLWFARHYTTSNPNFLLLDNALATMGAGLPSAMEIARLGSVDGRSVKSIAVVGDGGFMMNSQEIETAVRIGLNLIVIIVNDSSYGMIKWKQEAVGFSDFGLDFKNPDFVKYAESYGACGYKITSTAEFKSTLIDCLNKQGVHIIDTPVDYSYNAKVMTDFLASRPKV